MTVSADILPGNVKVEEISSRFTKDGVLCINAPKDAAKKQVEEGKKLQITTEE